MLQNIEVPDHYLDIIYSGRNKQYGGYRLRKGYNRRMMLAGAIAIVIAGLVFAVATLSIKEPLIYDLPDIPRMGPPFVLGPIPKADPKKPGSESGNACHGAPEKKSPASTIKKIGPPVIQADNKAQRDREPDLRQWKNEMSADLKNTDGVGTGGDASASGAGGTGDDSGQGGGEQMGAKDNDNEIHLPATRLSVMPRFKGNVQEYIKRHLRYPEQAIAEEIEGKVYLQFVVRKDGSIDQIKVIRGLGGGCSQEAVRVIGGMPEWEPGMLDGQPVDAYFRIPINFVLEGN